MTIIKASNLKAMDLTGFSGGFQELLGPEGGVSGAWTPGSEGGVWGPMLLSLRSTGTGPLGLREEQCGVQIRV